MTTVELHGDVLEIVLDNPPANALGASLRQAIAKDIAHAQNDGAVHAIVIRGGGKQFLAGANISERCLGKGPQSSTAFNQRGAVALQSIWEF